MPLINDTILQNGKYRIKRFLSSGGFGCTYEGEFVTLDNTRVAIKEFFVESFNIRDEQTGRVSVVTASKKEVAERLRRSFMKEARAIYEMHHSNVVKVLDFFEENDTAYYVMEYIDGESLRDLVNRKGMLSEKEALGYIRQVASALEYIHSRTRLHLDVKPANIMIDQKGRAVLIDFGASKHYDKETHEETSTLLGMNTPGYAPIEQMSKSFSSFNPATDIYALGATLYKLLTGVTPPDAITLLDGESALAPLPDGVSQATRNAVAAAMRIKRSERPQSIAEFIKILDGKGAAEETTKYSGEEGGGTISGAEDTVLTGAGGMPPQTPRSPKPQPPHRPEIIEQRLVSPIKKKSTPWVPLLIIAVAVVLVFVFIVAADRCSGGSEVVSDTDTDVVKKEEIVDVDSDNNAEDPEPPVEDVKPKEEAKAEEPISIPGAGTSVLKFGSDSKFSSFAANYGGSSRGNGDIEGGRYSMELVRVGNRIYGRYHNLELGYVNLDVNGTVDGEGNLSLTLGHGGEQSSCYLENVMEFDDGSNEYQGQWNGKSISKEMSLDVSWRN